MSFSNKAIEALPQAQSIPLTPISPLHAWFCLVMHTLVFAVLAAVSAFFLWQPWFDLVFLRDVAPYTLGATLVLFVLFAGYRFVANRKLAYGVREHDITLRAGWYWRSITTQPLLRVQHIEVERGPLERRAGLATLALFSAGGELHTLSIPGLTLARAEALRQFVLAYKAEQHVDQGASDV
ncbi:PH domain-containing protein [Salinibius halmophilus]|uniref:PH domain-containing protein n=1 Tax=Salinibius halmophilus TaxID=1853216 RepID=UPI000E665DC3|nr:PH domain-containing protein [Salinibius halmophilus]